VLTVLRKRLAKDDEGFTLIELMVVVLIIAILIAIAIPTFLGARNRAQERSTQSNLRNALTAAKTIYTDNSTYVAATLVALEAAAPELEFVAAASASTDPKQISVSTPNANEVRMVAKVAGQNKCFAIADNVNSGTTGPDVVDGDCMASTTGP
jgi:type IV pilus assembly protein PilA